VMRLGGEEGVGCVEIGSVLQQRVVGAGGDGDGRDDESRDAKIESRRWSWRARGK
jgi:hypothetical protein